MSDEDNIVEWIRGKADLKEGLAFPPDFLKREFVLKPVAKPAPKPETKGDVIQKATMQGVSTGTGKTGKIPAKGKVEPKVKKPLKARSTEGPVIRVINSDFGHKPGSLAATKSSGFTDGMTVAEFKSIDLGIGKGWQSGHLKNMVRRGFLKIEE